MVALCSSSLPRVSTSHYDCVILVVTVPPSARLAPAQSSVDNETHDQDANIDATYGHEHEDLPPEFEDAHGPVFGPFAALRQ